MPTTYKELVSAFGSGWYGSTLVCGVSESETPEVFTIPVSDAGNIFFACIDDQAGGYCGSIVDQGVCGEEVFAIDGATHEIERLGYEDVFEMIFDREIREILGM